MRALFRLYAERGNLGRVEEAAERRGIRSKPRTTRTGQRAGGQVLTRGQIHHLLTNVTYRGLTKHKEEAFPGLHAAIVDEALWDRVQAKLREGSARSRGRREQLGRQSGLGAEPGAAGVVPELRTERALAGCAGGGS